MHSRRRILFVCVGNTCRSQMAEGFARHYGGGRFELRSAGTSALGYVAGSVVEVMRERGVDISGHTSDQLTPAMIEWAHTVVTIGCTPADQLCPSGFSGRKLHWDVRDPFGGSMETLRQTRDEIERRVLELLENECHGSVLR